MPSTSSLLKSGLHNSIAEGLFNEIQNRSARYYYFLGKTLEWDNELSPPYPTDSFDYELRTRNEIITMKEIKSTDVAFVVERRDWTSDTVYDMFDDKYSDELDSIDLVSGGYGFADAPVVTIAGGGGSGATAVATVSNGVIIDISLTHHGRGYTSEPTVTITGGGGEGAAAVAKLPKAFSGVQRIETANYYVMTDEYNVYKCLDNNNNSESTYKPVGTTVDPVVMPDGYMWKYLYSIPIALRNKFFTDQYIPVVTALRGQFYSNGNIQNVRIDKAGKDYTFASISVVGDGYRESDPLLITGSSVTLGGSGYNSGATVTIDPPFAANAWTNGVQVLLGQKFYHGYNIYEVTLPGNLASPAPTHKSGIVSNGTAALKYIGTTARATAAVTGGVVQAINLIGSVLEVNIATGGSGYTTAPTVTFVNGGGSGVVAAAVMTGTSVQKVVIYDSGDNFTSTPSVVFGTQWTASTELTVGKQVFYSNRLYTVTVAGTTGTSFPTHTSGSASNGTATLSYAGSPASGAAVLRYGAGYSTLPQLLIQPVAGGSGAAGYFNGAKSEAKLIPLISGGQISGIQIDDGGVGYTYANLTVQGDGTDAELTADLSPGDISTLQANTELLTIDGRIMSCKVQSGGFGYATATVTIEGDGTGATAEAVLSLGRVVKINMTNYGQGYRWARITITGNGYGAKARAIITPFGGHGKDSINGLYARSLMFYTNVSKDKNQGFDVNNDFRQIGIIKNPRAYGNTENLDAAVASACFVVTGDINLSQFSQDMIIRLASSNAKFRIINLNANSALIQSLDNDTPVVGGVMSNEASQTFGINGVTVPTVDKYSGDLLFIDNKQAFTPTADQTVTMRTVIKF
jgi:hypothetical protein